jgi:pimeloyl-ACP methyl ester carboxylesterase
MTKFKILALQFTVRQIMKLIAGAIAVSAALLVSNVNAAEKPTVVLVHGAFEDAQVWQGVKQGLKADGYDVVAVNLPGRPSSPLPVNQVSLDLYRETVLQAMTSIKGPVVLVGHSFGGVTISNVAESVPAKVKSLVYVAAYLPKDGESLFTLATSDKDSKVGPHLQIQKDKGIASVDYSARAELFANDAPPEIKKVIPDLIIDEPLAPLATPVHLTAQHFGKVDKMYVHTAKDEVVSPSLQKKMVEQTPVRQEVTLNTGHTPFITDVPDLVSAIEKAAN